MDSIVTLVCCILAQIPVYYKLHQSNKKKEDAVENMTKAMGFVQLESKMNNCCIRGYKTIEDMKSVSILYVPYHECGWNGDLDALHEEFEKLPLRTLHDIIGGGTYEV